MAIIDLDIAAPDVTTPGRSRVYTTSVRGMTPVADLRDKQR